MNILFIGGTGTISTAISKALLEAGHSLYLINRGNRNQVLPKGAISLIADINDEDKVAELIKDLSFDAVADFIAFTPDQLERDYRLFKNKTKQFVFISSASAYQKPLLNYSINESTPLVNPFWKYSRNKIACEDYLMQLYREENFPVTIVRPSHTYDERSIPVGLHGEKGGWQVVKRILEGKKVIIHGDGTSLWTLTHSKDFAKAFVGLLGNIHAIGEAVQITSDESLTWNQIYRTIADMLGKPLQSIHISSEFLSACGYYDMEGGLLGDKSNTVVFDNSKIKALVPSFCADTRFDQGARESLAYILAHPEFQVEDEAFDNWCDKVIEAVEKSIRQLSPHHT
jgi:nucleoside-diphosphate-sugar epimerase